VTGASARDRPLNRQSFGNARREETTMLTGSCLCSAVRYEIDGKIGPVGHCHCATCRKAQGGAFVTNAPVRTKYFRLVTGA
jgi:hypothetical protein